MKKVNILILFIVFVCVLVLSANSISAELDVSSKPISDNIIIGIDEPAVFELNLRNLGDTDKFEIYSLVDVDLSSIEPFIIPSGASKTITLEVTPRESLLMRRGFVTFKYKVKDSKNNVQEETLTINILELGDGAFSVAPEPINPKSEFITIVFENKAKRDFLDLKIKMTSAFFDYESELPIKSLETKEIEIPLNKEKLKTLNAGSFLFNTQIETEGNRAEIEKMIKFLEQEGIDSSSSEEGILIRREEYIRKNIGNIRKTITINSEKNIISNWFTTYSIEPTKVETIGIKKHLTWEKDLIPNEEFKLIIRTNWFYPIVLIILVVVILILIKRAAEKNLILKKNVSFVRTKGGEFALKVRIKLKSKKFLERINVIDKLPPLVNLYKRFGAIEPSKIDMNNRRLEWNIESLNKGEERIFSYIIYSKIGVVGRFELPSARAIYEKEGKVSEVTSNRSFFINEPAK